MWVAGCASTAEGVFQPAANNQGRLQSGYFTCRFCHTVIFTIVYIGRTSPCHQSVVTFISFKSADGGIDDRSVKVIENLCTATFSTHGTWYHAASMS